MKELKKYIVPVKIIFEGYVIVEAETKKEASDNIKENYNGIIQSHGDPSREEYVDWDIPIHSTETKVGFIMLEK